MSSTFKVALIQTWPKPLRAEENFQHAAAQIHLAAAGGAALAVLPEYHLTGWAPDESSFALTPFQAQDYRQRYQKLALTHRINICAGTIVLQTPNHSDEKRPFLLNTSYFIDNEGRLLGEYTKTNLWIPERLHLTSNMDYARHMEADHSSFSPHQVIDTPLGRVGILVCWDIAFPEAFRQLVLAGAKTIIIPSFWTLLDMGDDGRVYNSDCEKLFVQSTLITRAFESTAAVIFCNAGGPAEDGFFGCSQVTLPIVGRVHGSFTDASEGMRIVDVDMSIVDIAERNYQIRQDLRKDDWHYGYQNPKIAVVEKQRSVPRL